MPRGHRQAEGPVDDRSDLAGLDLPPLPAPVDQLWHVLLDLAERLTAPWTLVGGQMVLLHALEHGQEPPQISQDGDVIADVRTSRLAVKATVGALPDLGFHLAAMTTEGVAHRYERPRQSQAAGGRRSCARRAT